MPVGIADDQVVGYRQYGLSTAAAPADDAVTLTDNSVVDQVGTRSVIESDVDGIAQSATDVAGVHVRVVGEIRTVADDHGVFDDSAPGNLDLVAGIAVDQRAPHGRLPVIAQVEQV